MNINLGKNKNSSFLEERITGTFSVRFFTELFSNSAYFPISNILLELLIEKPAEYLMAPDLYVMIFSALIQSYYLVLWQSKSPSRKLIGNLIGPAIYTVAESLFEGLGFFYSANHLGYWVFASVIGLLQTLRLSMAKLSSFFIIIENVVRTSILFFMYAIFETYTNSVQTISWSSFFMDKSHVFIGLAILLVGLSIGLANLTAEYYLKELQQTSKQLHVYSEWLLGPDLLAQVFLSPSSLHIARRERTVLFMDIRGFTAWSEKHTPEEVLALLDNYYHVAETVLSKYSPIKFKLSADEVMAIFSNADSATDAGIELRQKINLFLQKEGLGVGIGLECGLVVEGLLGGEGVKFYDAIGDTVNTAKRIESSAQKWEILVSENVKNRIINKEKFNRSRQIYVKGKEHPIIVFSSSEEET